MRIPVLNSCKCLSLVVLFFFTVDSVLYYVERKTTNVKKYFKHSESSFLLHRLDFKRYRNMIIILIKFISANKDWKVC